MGVYRPGPDFHRATFGEENRDRQPDAENAYRWRDTAPLPGRDPRGGPVQMLLRQPSRADGRAQNNLVARVDAMVEGVSRAAGPILLVLCLASLGWAAVHFAA